MFEGFLFLKNGAVCLWSRLLATRGDLEVPNTSQTFPTKLPHTQIQQTNKLRIRINMKLN